MRANLIELLQQACALPLKPDVFREGYAQVLEALSQPGDFDLFGLQIHSPAHVYSPHETSSTRFFMSHFDALGLLSGAGDLLEVGCGAGAIALLAARQGWTVTAVDIDPVAVAQTQANAQRNQLAVQALESDLFAAVSGQKFDVILFNPPFCHIYEPQSANERMLTDFQGGVYTRFMQEARDYLNPGAYVGVALGNCSNADFACPGWHYEVAAFDYSSVSNNLRVLFKATPQSAA